MAAAEWPSGATYCDHDKREGRLFLPARFLATRTVARPLLRKGTDALLIDSPWRKRVHWYPMNDPPEPPGFDLDAVEEEFVLLADIAAAHHVPPDEADGLVLDVMLSSLLGARGVDRRPWLIAAMTSASRMHRGDARPN